MVLAAVVVVVVVGTLVEVVVGVVVAVVLLVFLPGFVFFVVLVVELVVVALLLAFWAGGLLFGAASLWPPDLFAVLLQRTKSRGVRRGARSTPWPARDAARRNIIAVFAVRLRYATIFSLLTFL